MFALISSFLSNRWLWVVLDGKSLQEYPVNVGVPQSSNIAVYADDTTLYSKCNQASDQWQQLEVALLSLNLIYKTPWTGAGSGLLISMLEKLN